MKTMAISEFKSHALRVLDNIAKSQESLVITKRGKPIVQIEPFHQPTSKSVPGKLADTILFEEDIVSPLGEEIWEVTR